MLSCTATEGGNTGTSGDEDSLTDIPSGDSGTVHNVHTGGTDAVSDSGTDVTANSAGIVDLETDATDHHGDSGANVDSGTAIPTDTSATTIDTETVNGSSDAYTGDTQTDVSTDIDTSNSSDQWSDTETNSPLGTDVSTDSNTGTIPRNDTNTAADTGSADTGAPLGEVHSGMYHLGPVDFDETEWHNACAPDDGYRSELRDVTGLGGEYIAGLSSELADKGGTCDACILIETAMGHSIVARVVTYGAENAPGDIDVSPSVYGAINEDEWPRDMTWQFTTCPDTGSLYYEFQTGSNVWWTSLWVRNPKVPIAKVEVQSKNHATYVELKRGTDGTLTDGSGFGTGAFTLRITAIDGQIIEQTFDGFEPGALIASNQQFD